MSRNAFYSFHYKPDNWRVAQVRNMGLVEGNKPASDNDWETISKSDDSIKKWINGQLEGKSVSIVLIGANTSGRKWINYEIKQSWDNGKGLLGIHIHKLKDKDGNQAVKGSNPFGGFTFKGKELDKIVATYDPPYSNSNDAYNYIKANLAGWIEEAIKIRKSY